MQLIPYLYAAFARYARTGLPPFRPLVVDFPGDSKVYPVDDAFLVGPSLLVAPAFVGQRERKVYFPEGAWHCFWTGEIFQGGQEVVVPAPLERIRSSSARTAFCRWRATCPTAPMMRSLT